MLASRANLKIEKCEWKIFSWVWNMLLCLSSDSPLPVWLQLVRMGGTQKCWQRKTHTDQNTQSPCSALGFFLSSLLSTSPQWVLSSTVDQEPKKLSDYPQASPNSNSEFTRVRQESLAFFVLYKCTLRILQCSKKWEKGSIADVYADNTNIMQEQVIDNRYWFFNNRTWTWRVSCIT